METGQKYAYKFFMEHTVYVNTINTETFENFDIPASPMICVYTGPSCIDLTVCCLQSLVNWRQEYSNYKWTVTVLFGHWWGTRRPTD